MSVKLVLSAFAAGVVGLAAASQAAVLSSVVKADLSGGVGGSPVLTSADNGTDPHGFGATVNVNAGTNSLDSLGSGIFSRILASTEYGGGPSVSGGGGLNTAGGDTPTVLANATTLNAVTKTFAAPASTAGTLTVNGLAFASGGNVSGTRAATVRVQILWFGSDGAIGGSGSAADVYLTNGANNYVDINATAYQTDTSDGTAAGTQNAGVYYVKLSPTDYLTLNTNSNATTALNKFRVILTPLDGNIRLKTNSSTNQTFFDSKIAVAGNFAAVPEPALLSGVALAAVALLRRRRA